MLRIRRSTVRIKKLAGHSRLIRRGIFLISALI